MIKPNGARLAGVVVAVLLVCLVTLIARSCGMPMQQAPSGDGTAPAEQEPLADDTTIAEEGRLVGSITTIVERQAKTVDWSHQKDKIAFGKWANDGYVDVYLMNPDGSDRECLTCNKPGCPQKHNGNPAWHPAGDYIVFTAEKEDNPEGYSQWASSRRFNFTTDVDMPRQFEFRFQPKTGFLGIGFNCS